MFARTSNAQPPTPLQRFKDMSGRKQALSKEMIWTLEGIRDACLIGAFHPLAPVIAQCFPSISFPHRSALVFFKDGEALDRFYRDGVYLKPKHVTSKIDASNVLDYRHDALGKSLGFYPPACDSFVNNREVHTDRERSAGVFYNGLQFTCPLSIVADCILWLRSTYGERLPVELLDRGNENSYIKYVDAQEGTQRLTFDQYLELIKEK